MLCILLICFSPLGARGGGEVGLDQALFQQLSPLTARAPSTLCVRISNLALFNVVTTHNNLISRVEHILGPLYVFFTLGRWARGVGVPSRLSGYVSWYSQVYVLVHLLKGETLAAGVNSFLLGGSGIVVPLRTSATSTPWRPSHAGASMLRKKKLCTKFFTNGGVRRVLGTIDVGNVPYGHGVPRGFTGKGCLCLLAHWAGLLTHHIIPWTTQMQCQRSATHCKPAMKYNLQLQQRPVSK